MEKRLAIGLPISWQFVHSDFFDSFVAMEKPDFDAIRMASGSIEEMRNRIAERALDLECTHLLFLDADMSYPPDTITKLLANDVDICGALCFKRWPPFIPTLFIGEKYEMKLMDPWPSGLVEVTATGTGCLMIKTDVFNQIKYPWFEFTKNENGDTVGEDIGFCYKAADVGIKVHVDTTIETEHIAQMRINRNWYELNKQLIKNNNASIGF